MYLLFTLMFAFPALMTEIAVGKKSGKGTVHALQLVLGEKFGGIAGYLLLAIVTIAGSYYAVLTLDKLSEAEGRQELTLNFENPLVFIEDSAEEVLGGEVKISIRKTPPCKFLTLDLTAILGQNEETYVVKIKLENPYVYP